MNLLERYQKKENYVNREPANWWKGHLDPVIVGEYADMMGDRILDVGCNSGRLTYHMSKMFKSVVGIDLNREAIESAKSAFKHIKNLHFICCLANDIPFADGSFSGTFCFQMLEHLFREDIKPTLKEMSRVVCANGYLLVVMPRAGDEEDAIRKVRAYDPAHEVFLRSESEVRDFFGPEFKIISMKHETRPNPGRPEEKPHNSWVVLLKNVKEYGK